MTKLLKIAELGDPILRKRADEVLNIDEKIKELMNNMDYTVDKVNGVGLAAPQVFHSKRIFIIASKPSKRYPDAPLMKPTAIINPVITKISNETVKDWEGCLSIPGIRALVPRAKHIEVEYINVEGQKTVVCYDDFLARIFQHEYDHIEGIVFLDRLETNSDIITENEYQKLFNKD